MQSVYQPPVTPFFKLDRLENCNASVGDTESCTVRKDVVEICHWIDVLFLPYKVVVLDKIEFEKLHHPGRCNLFATVLSARLDSTPYLIFSAPARHAPWSRSKTEIFYWLT